jgi:hypothetical protein
LKGSEPSFLQFLEFFGVAVQLFVLIGVHRRLKKQDSGSRIQRLVFRVFPCVSVADWISSASIGG